MKQVSNEITKNNIQVLQFFYDSIEERSTHIKEMESQGYTTDKYYDSDINNNRTYVAYFEKTNTELVIRKIADNNFCVFDPQFKQPHRKEIQPIIGWLGSMDVLNTLPEDGKFHLLVDFLKNERNKYDVDSFTLEQIDRVISFN